VVPHSCRRFVRHVTALSYAATVADLIGVPLLQLMQHVQSVP